MTQTSSCSDSCVLPWARSTSDFSQIGYIFFEKRWKKCKECINYAYKQVHLQADSSPLMKKNQKSFYIFKYIYLQYIGCPPKNARTLQKSASKVLSSKGVNKMHWFILELYLRALQNKFKFKQLGPFYKVKQDTNSLGKNSKQWFYNPIILSIQDIEGSDLTALSPILLVCIPVNWLSKVYICRLIKPISCILTVYPIDHNKRDGHGSYVTCKMTMWNLCVSWTYDEYL